MSKQWIVSFGLVAAIALVVWLCLPRYQLAMTGEAGVAFKLDTWTGTTWFCNGVREQCHELQTAQLPMIDPAEIDAAIKAQRDKQH